MDTNTPQEVGEEMIYVSKSKLEILLNQNESLKNELEERNKEISLLKKIIFEVMYIVGLADEQRKPIMEYFAGESIPFTPILKGLGKLMKLVGSAQAPDFLGGKEAKRKLADQFSFLKDIGPLMEKYGAGK